MDRYVSGADGRQAVMEDVSTSMYSDSRYSNDNYRFQQRENDDRQYPAYQTYRNGGDNNIIVVPPSVPTDQTPVPVPCQPPIVIVDGSEYHHQHGGLGRALGHLGVFLLNTLEASNIGVYGRHGGFHLGGYGGYGYGAYGYRAYNDGYYNTGYNNGCGDGYYNRYYNPGYDGGYYNPGYGGRYYNPGYGGGYYNPGYGGGYYNPGYGGGYYNPGYGGGCHNPGYGGGYYNPGYGGGYYNPGYGGGYHPFLNLMINAIGHHNHHGYGGYSGWGMMQGFHHGQQNWGGFGGYGFGHHGHHRC